MPPTRRIIHKLQPPAPRTFDEQLWPVYLAIVVLGAYLMGVVVATLSFDTPRLHLNAATWLTTVTILVGLTLWGVGNIQSHWLRRTVLLSLLLSLIVNLSLLIVMAGTGIFRPLWTRERPMAVKKDRKPEIVVPEYAIWPRNNQDNPTQDFEKPVETGVPEAEERIELTRQQVQPTAQDNPQLPTPDDSRVAVASTQPQRVSLPTVPRRNDEQAVISRQLSRARPYVGQLEVTQPTPTQPRQQPSALQAQTNAVQRSRADTPTPSTTTQPEDAAPHRYDPIQFARQAPEPAPQIAASSPPTLRRRLAQPIAAPPAATPLDSSLSSARMTEDDSPRANATLLQQQATAAPVQDRRTIDLVPQIAVNLPRSRRTDLDVERSDSLIATTPASPRSRANAAAHVDIQTTQPRVETNRPPTVPNASSATVSQQTTTNDVIATSTTEASTQLASEASTPLARLPSVRAANAAAPSVGDAPRVAAITRAQQSAVVPTSPRAEVDGPASAEAVANSTPAAEPSRMALAQSTLGVAGIGQALNLDRGVAAPETPATIASASASRAKIMQDQPPGPAITPSAPAMARRMRAGQDVPRTSLKAQPVDVAAVPGTRHMAQLDASASATLERASANAPSGPITASKGSAEVDLGPTRIAADTGRGRASGGGQPQVSPGDQPRALARLESSARLAAPATDVKAQQFAAAAGQQTDSFPGTEAAASEVARVSENDSLPASAAAAVGDALPASTPEVGVATDLTRRAGTQEHLSLRDLEAGGGTETPGRRIRPLQITLETDAPEISLAGTPQSAGQEQGQPLDAQGTRPDRATTGVLTASMPVEVGAVAGPTEIEGSLASHPAMALARRDLSPSDEGAAMPSDDLDRGARRIRRQPIAASTGTEVAVEIDAISGSSESDLDSREPVASSVDAGELAQRSDAALPVPTQDTDAAGGIGDEPSLDIGILSRQAQNDREEISFQTARFVRRDAGGTPQLDTSVVVPAKAFRRRLNRKGEEPAGERGRPSPKTEAAIELGLVFLSRHQAADGSWSLDQFRSEAPNQPDETASISSDTAATALALLSFLGAGYHHKDDRYQDVVKSGLEFLLKNQKPDGDLYIDQDSASTSSAWLYSHAIAAIALCEAYGMTQDPQLRDPAQRALNFIAASQHPSRGGWRYTPGFGTDTSVTGWMVMALKSGDLAGLDVSGEVYEKVTDWLDVAQASRQQPYLFRYNPYAPDTETQRHGRRPTRAITAVGLLLRLYSGWRRDNEQMIHGADILLQNPPVMGTDDRPRRDTYYWYYATQVMFHMGGAYWEEWNQHLHPLLVDTQIAQGPLAGSWNPMLPVPDRWAAHGGRLYVTTMNLLSLEVYYRHLPIYDDTAK